jgi:hypothetical protein
MNESWLRNMGVWILLACLVAVPSRAWAKEAAQQWEIVNPAGVIKSEPVTFVARPTGLEGKTVVLRWNAKPNGDILLNRLAELLVKNIKGIKVIKAWEVAPETRIISYGHATSLAVAKKLASLKPDLVIAAPAD